MNWQHRRPSPKYRTQCAGGRGQLLKDFWRLFSSNKPPHVSTQGSASCWNLLGRPHSGSWTALAFASCGKRMKNSTWWPGCYTRFAEVTQIPAKLSKLTVISTDMTEGFYSTINLLDSSSWVILVFTRYNEGQGQRDLWRQGSAGWCNKLVQTKLQSCQVP